MTHYDFSAMIFLAQDGAAPPRESAGAQPAPAPGTPGTPGAPGTPGTTAAPGSPGSPGSTGPAAPRSSPTDLFGGGTMWVVLVILLIFIVMSMSGTRREKRKRETMLNALKKHDKVQTIGGVIGSVVEVKASTVVLKVDESSNTRMTFARTAIQQVLDAAPDSESSSTNEAAA